MSGALGLTHDDRERRVTVIVTEYVFPLILEVDMTFADCP
jgi:hypothetical protein